jgi:drug/metabolite transporter (DMT)-like permease
MIKYLVLLASVAMTVTASTLLKIGSAAVDFSGSLSTIFKGYLASPLIIAGFAAYALAALLWVYCLANFDLGYATFVASVQYIMLLAVAIFVFHEHISLLKWLGSFLIMIGVFCWLKG